MAEYSKLNVKLSDKQPTKLETAVKNKTETTLRMNLEMLHVNDPPHQFLLTIRQKTKLQNPVNNNISTEVKLSKAQIAKII